MTNTHDSNTLASVESAWTEFKSASVQLDDQLSALFTEMVGLNGALETTAIDLCHRTRAEDCNDCDRLNADLEKSIQNLEIARSEIESLQRRLSSRAGNSEDRQLVDDLVRERSQLNVKLHEAQQRIIELESQKAQTRLEMDDRQIEFNDEMKRLRRVVERQSELLTEIGVPQNSMEPAGSQP